MKFCQVDGSELTVAEEPAFDPYATIVSSPANPIVAPPEEAPAENKSMSSVPIAPPSDVLDLPAQDPLKTMLVSDSELKQVLQPAAEEPVLDVPPANSEPSVSMPSAPAPPPFIADAAPPPSPFSAPEPEAIPVPDPVVHEAAPAYDEPETKIQPSVDVPFEPPAPVQEWNPPPVPDAQWQNQEVGSNTPFNPPPAGVEGQNKTLALVSLILGILGLTICCGGFLPSIAALITGFMARGKANSDPSAFGGAGMAMGGIITGALGLVGAIVIWIIYGGLILSGGGIR